VAVKVTESVPAGPQAASRTVALGFVALALLTTRFKTLEELEA
jgi:hypothetical protein